MNPGPLSALAQVVQTNCHIADARHAADLTLCTYLLQMREFYRWEQGLPFGAPLRREAVGAWIAAREALWNELEGQDYRPLPLGDGGAGIDPFDVAAVNARLQGSDQVYGAGLAGRGQAVFFLADLHPAASPGAGGLPVQVSAREWARGLMAPPAVLDARVEPPTIVVRREALARWCWQLVEGYSLRPRPGSAFDAVVRAWGLDRDFDAALPCFLDHATQLMVLHETGEHRAGQALGAPWAALRAVLPTRRGELLARAIRDHLADLAVTLPALLDGAEPGSLHFWFATYDGMREQLFPSLPRAYQAWRQGDGGRALRDAAACGQAHFLALAARAMAHHASQGDAAAAAVEALLGSAEAVCRWDGPG